MLYAIDQSGKKTGARPGALGHCPACGAEMTPKCGDINVWHWAHKTESACDYEPETLWHSELKRMWAFENQEIVKTKLGQKRIADIITNSGTTIEFQHSPISVRTVSAREYFWNKMIWVFDARAAFDADRLTLNDKDGYYTFRWKHARKVIAICNAPVYLDLGPYIFLIKKVYLGPPFAGWGRLYEHRGLIDL